MVLGCIQLNAQTPKYYYSLASKGSQYTYGYSRLNSSSKKNNLQNLYYPADFNHPPKGLITHIYLHHAYQTFYSQVQGLPSRIPKFRVRMGLTTSDSFIYIKEVSGVVRKCQPISDEGLLQTVIYDTVYTIPDTLINNSWLRLPLQYPFFYTPNKNLIIEISSDSNTMMNPKDSFQTTTYYNGPHLYTSTYDKYRKNYDSVNLGVYTDTIDNVHIESWCTGTTRLDFGFDLDTTVNSIDDISKQPLRVYPNPAVHTLSLIYSGNPNTQYQISNITGQVVQIGTVSNHTIDIRHLPRGMYLLRMGYEVVRFFKEEE